MVLVAETDEKVRLPVTEQCPITETLEKIFIKIVPVNFQFAFYTNWTSKPRVLEVEGKDNTKLQVGFCSCLHQTAASFITCESEETINRSLTLEFDAGFLIQTATYGKCGGSNGRKNCYMQAVNSDVIFIIDDTSLYTKVKFDNKYKDSWEIYEIQQLKDIFQEINGYPPIWNEIEFKDFPLNVAPTVSQLSSISITFEIS
ncbi:unnamed protein product [Dibothriocephalus latus]|uniref:Uncharacterized protein n=1 Tax=Dibothriocephalus latus TaxID=60516 RepID=A0A3P7L0G2_DIBLA|nr:unnamed protein product [Dibothriocephalus latus]